MAKTNNFSRVCWPNSFCFRELFSAILLFREDSSEIMALLCPEVFKSRSNIIYFYAENISISYDTEFSTFNIKLASHLSSFNYMGPVVFKVYYDGCEDQHDPIRIFFKHRDTMLNKICLFSTLDQLRMLLMMIF